MLALNLIGEKMSGGPCVELSFFDILVGELTLPGNTAGVHLVVPVSLKTKQYGR
jgi:hypothetical protein